MNIKIKTLEEAYLNILKEMHDSNEELSNHISKLSEITPRKVSNILEYIREEIQTAISELSSNSDLDVNDVEIDIKNSIIDGVLKGLNNI